MTYMTSATRLEHDAADLRSANLHRLEQLAAVLASQGIEASPMAPQGRVPRLHVTHPDGDAEAVYVWRCQDGQWWFWWPWAERIGSEADLDVAAAKIEQQLRKPPAG
jgi:hypothetical protein